MRVEDAVNAARASRLAAGHSKMACVGRSRMRESSMRRSDELLAERGLKQQGLLVHVEIAPCQSNREGRFTWMDRADRLLGVCGKQPARLMTEIYVGELDRSKYVPRLMRDAYVPNGGAGDCQFSGQS
ncbi:hypothetical protein Tco_0819963 [Tanacetum coccineum]|uniref:Uncharacterized protein n=1 Tax=Tanacetum coccineum TaxID=301880 RepID=A0ABQ5ACS7_9ASTR